MSRRLMMFTAVVLAAMLLLGAGFVVGEVGVASGFALPAGSYGGTDASSLWYYGEDALGLYDAKQVIDNLRPALRGTDPVIIAVVDTGMTAAHEIFEDVLLKNSAGEVMGDNSTRPDTGGSVDISDTSTDRHGNAVAGVIAMLIHETGLEDYIKIYPIKASEKKNVAGQQNVDAFSIASITEAISRARDKVGADVINLSLGRQFSETDEWAKNADLAFAVNSVAKDALIVAAAGNNSKKSDDDPFYPAAMDGIFSVMGYGEGGELYSSSNYGALYDIAAPAQNIYTASDLYGSRSEYTGGHNGTSMAAPFVSFAAALLKLRFKAEGREEPDPMTIARLLRSFDFEAFEHGGTRIRRLSLAVMMSSDLDDVDINYSMPTSVKITHNGKLGTGDSSNVIVYDDPRGLPEINFVADLTPYGMTDPELNDYIVWSIRDANGNEKTLGRGPTLTYRPDIYGQTEIVAKLSFDQNVFGIQKMDISFLEFVAGDALVTYAQYASDTSGGVPTSGVLYTGETTLFTFAGSDFVDPSVEIKWYVDRQLVATGKTFAYTPKTAGEHVISVQYGNYPPTHIPGVAFVADVKPFILRPLDLSMLILGCAIVLAGGITLIVLRVKRKRAAEGPKPPKSDRPRKPKKEKRDKNITIAKR